MSTFVQQPAGPGGGDLGLPAPAEPLRPVGARQHAFWILQQLAPDSAVSNLSIVLRTTRQLRWWPLHAAMNHLVARHSSLRTRFPAAAGVPLRHVSAADDVTLTVEVGAATEDDLTQRLHAAARRPFDLTAELPVRVDLFQIAGGGSALLLVVHHAVSDAMSLAMLTDELARVYDAMAAGGAVPDELRDPVHEPAETPGSPQDVRFWAEHLRGVDTALLTLPGARPSPARPTFAGGTMVSPLAPDTRSAIDSLRRVLGSTENLLLLTAFYLTLFRHGAGPDLVVGVPVTGRSTAGVTGLGFNVSTLPLRVCVDPRASFADLARQVRDVFLNGVQHASVSVEEILTGLGHHSPDWRVPLFRHLFNYRPWDDSDISIAGERPVSPTIERDESRLDIQLTILGGDRGQMITNYSTEVHDRAEVSALLDRMELLLRAAAEDPRRPVSELDMLTDAERAVLAAVNHTARDEFTGRTVAERFFAHAATDPTAVAVIDEAGPVTYGDLAATARRAAARLRAEGVRDGDIVALALPRGSALAAAVLGGWAAGACYLPVDASHPGQRLATQLADAQARFVVTDGTPLEVDVPALNWEDLAAGEQEPAAAQPAAPAPETPAYVIYTSGSTGTPRGVVVEHGNLANVVLDFAERLGVTAGTAVLWSTTTAFDISGLELCMPLATGGTVVVASADAQTRPAQLLELVVKHDVAVVQATPTFWRLAAGEVDDELRGRTVLCGGEPMSAALAADLLRTGCRLFNVYGPTETTIWSTVARIDGTPADPVPIGGPLANTTVFVTDEYGSPLPPGMLGELCIGGAGVSHGYLHRPELTAERFPSSAAYGRYYRTGDLARWHADGTLELFGRNDRQVKLRGHRIELPEVEAVLRAHPDVLDAAVVITGDPQTDAELRAFVRVAPGTTIPEPALAGELWPYLSERLPSYALPSRLRVLAEFPVNPNGKTDHAALRALDLSEAPAGPPAPDDDGPDPDPELTARLTELWRDLLHRPALGEADHFFLNGGHSLLAAQLAIRVADITGQPVPLRMVFDHPTARRLSAHLAGQR
ncbi:amino acid adenylation domain-containing protein [Micromonospora sp. RTGN7]|uniref:non-ribosomal peptide synthetase n=1 Tax=Micromonospora sp. RTGN7 TaxID=3016526 RepID=UPI0029FEE678|nr:amino acid adenylation domain-containing protein [Micromonospora sp. RTGN7]